MSDNDHPQNENDIAKIASSFSMHPKLIRYYVSLVNSMEDMNAEAQFAAQCEQNEAAYWSSMIRQLEDHRKSCKVNLP